MTVLTVNRPGLADVKGDTEWSALEQALLAACPRGWPACLPNRDDLPQDDSDPDRRVRAGLIRYLMLGGSDEEGGVRPHPRGVEIVGGWIAGVLDLEGCETQLDLKLWRCRISERAILRDARIGALYLPGCTAPMGLNLHRLETRRDVHLNEEFVSAGAVDLIGARIGGALTCDGGCFAATKMALICGGARIKEAVRLGRGFEAKGEVNLVSAEIGGQLSCIGGRFGAAELALDCNGARIHSAVFLSDGFVAEGEVNFGGAQIGGPLACNGGLFKGKHMALNCNGANIGSAVFLGDGFAAEGEVNFVGTEIAGQLSCSDGRFAAIKEALNCNGARIGASVLLREGFHAAGLLVFARAEVTGHFVVQGATLDAGLTMEAARVGHGFFWQDVTGAREWLDLTEAHVGSLRDEWQSWAGCKTLILDGFRYDRLDGAMTVAQRLAWLGKARHKRRVVSNGAPDHHNGRDFDPQPHVQLAMILRAQGNRDGADRVLVDREARQRRAAWDRAHGRLDGTWRAARHSVQADLKRPIDWLFGLVAGYGHRPARLLVVAAVLVIMAAVLAGAAYDAGQFAPNSPVILTSTAWQAALAAHAVGGDKPLLIWLEGPTAADYEQFDRWLYGLDLFLPLDALGQEAAWRPTTGRGGWGDLAFYSRWFFQGMGWIVTALAAAVLTGLVGRRD